MGMTRDAQTIEDVRDMADEVARLMADRFGGARRGERPDMQAMLRRRGGALPRKLRRMAKVLAEADLHSAQPRIARQLDLPAISRAHHALIAHLQPLGEMSRWRNRALNFAASVLFGLMLLAAVLIWVMIRRGSL
ncbi:hypothetical protein SAMN05421772_106138 [Paracoccus saliphilus]|uniref:Uncharacterized protein n=2 Tax=Paracoccus saliphilus TaxID=405559 RepID=A0AA45W4F1_9RHOB|nr:hypothetical protein JHX88_04805 [Paracoccus saliphilus]SIS84581.1 hypothetical protein SAMN05421772_106138 [Paracoccus saliphilus]